MNLFQKSITLLKVMSHREIMFLKKLSLSGFLAGFTLVEVLVATFIFSLIIATTAGVFVSGLRAQDLSLERNQLLDQMSYTMEYLSRALRMAKKDLNNDCNIGAKMNYGPALHGPGIRFLNYKNECQEFYLDGTILKEEVGSQISPLTSPDFEVTSFKIGPSDSWDQDDDLQPRVTLFLEIKAKGKETPKLQLQTTISQRNLDIRR